MKPRVTHGLIIVFSLLLCRLDIFHNKTLRRASTNIFLLVAFCTPFALLPADEPPGVGLWDPGPDTFPGSRHEPSSSPATG